jgi:hypothetical protein
VSGQGSSVAVGVRHELVRSVARATVGGTAERGALLR